METTEIKITITDLGNGKIQIDQTIDKNANAYQAADALKTVASAIASKLEVAIGRDIQKDFNGAKVSKAEQNKYIKKRCSEITIEYLAKNS